MSTPQLWLARLGGPAALFIAVVLAVGFGLFAPDWAQRMAPLGDAYLALYKMVLLPFLLSAMLCSVSLLMRTPNAKAYVRGLLTVYPAGLLLAAAVGLAWALVLEPGVLANSSAGNVLGEIIDSSKDGYATDVEITLAPTQASLAAKPYPLAELIPANIFAALGAGDTLKVLVFGVLFGLAMGRSMSGRTELLDMLDGVYRSCQTFVRWLGYGLPLGLFAMLSAHVAESGVAPLVAMVGFVVAQTLGAATLAVLALAVVVWKTQKPPSEVLRALGQTLVLAVATRSSMACIPTAIEALVQRLKLPRLGVELLMPLGVTLYRFGPALYFSMCAVFVAQLYGRPLGAYELMLILTGSMLAAMASSGTTGVLSISLVSLVCVPLSLPYEAALVLFVAVDALIDPLRTLGIVLGNCAASSWVAGGGNSSPDAAPQTHAPTEALHADKPA